MDQAKIKAAIEGIDAATLSGLVGKSYLLTREWSDAEVAALIAVAEAFQSLDFDGKPLDYLKNQLNYAVFFDNSTRTKSAWAGASARLGSAPVIVDGSSTQVSHGETAEETGAMLGMNSHAMGIRHDLILGEGQAFMKDCEKGIKDYLAATGDPRQVPIVNLQCDIDHPTQSMADLLWLRERLGDVRGKKIAVSWAYSPSYAKPLSVPQGLIMLLPRMGAKVTLAHPEGYRLMDECLTNARDFAARSGGSFEVVDTMDAAFEDADVVYPKSWGPYDLMLERVEANRNNDKAGLAAIEQRCLERNARFKDWICDERRMALTREGKALYMHCLPADIGDEVDASVMDRHRVDVAREANKKVYVIMSALALAKLPDLRQRILASFAA